MPLRCYAPGCCTTAKLGGVGAGSLHTVDLPVLSSRMAICPVRDHRPPCAPHVLGSGAAMIGYPLRRDPVLKAPLVLEGSRPLTYALTDVYTYSVTAKKIEKQPTALFPLPCACQNIRRATRAI